jgi:hypothetical protein
MLGLSCIASATRAAAANGADPAAEAADPAPTPPPGGESQAAPRLTDSVLVSRTTSPGFAGLDAVFSGRLSVFSLPDLVEFLRSARRTGVLVCSSAAGMGTLRFSEGWICGAGAPGTPAVGELLMRSGKLSSDALAMITTPPESAQPDAVVAAKLVEQGLVDAAAVHDALRQQIELTLRELVRWSDGEFAFSREAGAVVAEVRIDAQELLLTLFKEMDESSRGASPSDGEA